MLRRLALLASSLAASVLAAELLLPFVPPHLGTLQRIVSYVDNSRKYQLRAGVAVPFSGMFRMFSPPIAWSINAQGLRAEAPVPALSDLFRIAAYGDSETFGWSVDFDATFERQMERLDPRVEVLNFGIPGYNAANVADYIQDTVPSYTPDLVVYLVNKNDVDPAHLIDRSVLKSEIVMRLRLFYEVVVTKPWRRDGRHSPDRLRFLADQLDRIAAYAASKRLPTVLAFMKARSRDEARQFAEPAGFMAIGAAGTPTTRALVVEDVLEPFPQLDDHMCADAHRALAARLCAEIAGNDEPGCVLPGWSPDKRRHDRAPGAPTTQTVAWTEPH